MADSSVRTLADWFERIGAAGLRAGVRERLLAHALLTRLALHGQLPDSNVERWGLLGPLLCANPQQQRDYARMLGELANAPAVPGTAARPAPKPPLASPQRTAWRLWIGGLVVLLMGLLVGLLVIFADGSGQQADPVPVPPSAPSQPAPGIEAPTVVNPAVLVAEVAASAIAQPVYVPQRPLSLDVPAPPAWAGSLRTGLGLLGGLALLFIGWRVWRRLKLRQPYLEAQEQRDDKVEQQLLRDCAEPDSPDVGPAAAVLAPVSRGLRQRIDGDRRVLDVRATIAATIRQGGRVLLPAWQTTQQTPEYLALVERAGEGDHQASYHEAVVEALRARGVTIELYFYRHSPEHGCWRLARARAAAPSADEARIAQGRVSVATLQARFPHHRLLVFGDASAALDPDTGELEPWTQVARLFVQRAWFTPLPVANWGRAEHWVAAPGRLDMLLLPLEDAALGTLTDWLASGRATLVQHPQAPYRYPPLLQGDEVEWAARRVAPPPEVLERLLRELRSYLGPKRMRWLAACALFPTLAWPLTLMLGRKTGFEDATERTLGVTTLGALPWFRHGRLPDWLREPLLATLSPQDIELLRAELLGKLERVVTPEPPQDSAQDRAVLARISRQRLRDWLRNAHDSVARDLLMVRFLEPALASRLAQRLPAVFRRWLLRDGSVLRGLRPQVEALALLPLLAGALALPGLWERLPVAQAPSAAPAQQWQAEPGLIGALALSPDGLQLATLGSQAGATPRRWWSATGQAVTGAAGWQPPLAASAAGLQQRPDGRQTARVVGSTITLATGQGQAVQSTELRGHGAAIQALAYSPDGRWLASAGADGQVMVWETSTGKPARSLAQTADPWLDVAWSGDSRRVVAANADGTVQVWDALTGDPVAAVNAPLPPGTARHSRLAADGAALFATGATGQVLRWGPAPPAAVAVLGCETRDTVPRVDDTARTLADRLVLGTAAGAAPPLPPLAAVAYTPAAWRTLRDGGTVPRYGQILVPAADAAIPAIRDAAQQLATWLGAQTAGQTWTVSPQPDLAAGQMVLSACKLPPPAVAEPRLKPFPWPQAAPDAARQGRLDAALNSLFATSRNARTQALQTLVTQADLVSDLLPMALRRAQRLAATAAAQAPADARARWLELLPLLQAAQPVTLQRHAREIYQWLDSLPADSAPAVPDPDTAALRAQLLAARARKPVVYLQIAHESQRAAARALQVQLIKAGLAAPGIELVGDKAPDRAELRVRGRSDQALARALSAGVLAKSIQSVPAVLWLDKADDPVDTFELWWPKRNLPPVGSIIKDCDVCPELVLLPRGSFMMGSPDTEPKRSADEGPVHRVTINYDLAVGKYEVTQGQWRAVMGSNPSNFIKDCGDNCPVEKVSWNDAQDYIKKLNARSGQKYRLLSEAEWEYAARAGTTTPFHTGQTITTDQANFDGNYTYNGSAQGVYRGKTVAVGSFAPNGFGLHDMHGNVWEWVQDSYNSSYTGAPADGSAWESGDQGGGRVLRGGSWGNDPESLRASVRFRYFPGFLGGGYSDIGFRVCRASPINEKLGAGATGR